MSVAGSEARRSAAAMPQVVSVRNDVEMDTGGDKPGLALTTTQNIKAGVISLVNPCFTNYSRPFLLASVVLALTAVGTGVVFFFEMRSQQTSCSSIVQYPQVVGSYRQQRAYVDYLDRSRNESVQDASAQTGNVRIRTETSACIQSAHVQVAATHQDPNQDLTIQTMSYAAHLSGTGERPQLSHAPGPVRPCIPPAGFRDGYEVVPYELDFLTPSQPGSQLLTPSQSDLQKLLSAPAWTQQKDAAKKIILCDSFSVGKLCTDWFQSQGKAGYQADYTICEATSEQDFAQRQPGLYNQLQCPAITSTAQELPWILTYRYEVLTCTTTRKRLNDAIGTAMAYSSYIEMAITALCVVVFTKMGIIFMTRAVRTSVLLELVDDDPQEELDRITAELKALKEQVEKLRQANVAQAQPTPQQEQQQGACCAGCGAPKKPGKNFCRHCGQQYAGAGT